MKAISRVVSTSFWEDKKVVSLFSPEDKYFFLYLLTNPHTTQLGVYKLIPKIAAFEMGYSIEAVKVLLDRFENKYKVLKFNPDTSEVAIKNFLKHSIIKGGSPVMDCLLKEERQVEDKSLLQYIYSNLNGIDTLNITVKQYVEHLSTVDTLHINDNDNDNERIVTRIVDESLQSPQKVNKHKGFYPPTTSDIITYCTEKKLTHVNPEAFIDFYESKNWMIGKNKMSSWRSAVSGWNRRAIERGDKPYKPKQVIQNRPKSKPEPEDDGRLPMEEYLKLNPNI